MEKNKTLSQEKQPEKQLYEAPTSASVKIKSARGFEYIFTLRDEHASNLMFKINAMEEKWLALHWTPVAQQQPRKFDDNKPEVVTKPCPVHPEELLKEKISKKNGKKYFSHSKGVYPDLDMCFGQGYVEREQA